MRLQRTPVVVLFILLGIGAGVPNDSYAIPILTANGAPATLTPLPGTCSINGSSGLTCYTVRFPTSLAPTTANSQIGFTFTNGTLYVGDTTSLDTLTLSTFTVTYKGGTNNLVARNLILDYENNYFNSSGGLYKFGARMGGFWGGNSFQNTESLVAKGENLGTGNPEVTQTFNGGAPSFNQPTPIATVSANCGYGGYGGLCGETLHGNFTARFQRSGTLTITNSLDHAAAPEDNESALLTYLTTAQANDPPDSGDCTGKLTGLPNANCRAGEHGQQGRDNAGTRGNRAASFALVDSADHGSPTIVNPEPSTWLLFGTGLGALALWNRKRRKSDE